MHRHNGGLGSRVVGGDGDGGDDDGDDVGWPHNVCIV